MERQIIEAKCMLNICYVYDKFMIFTTIYYILEDPMVFNDDM